jgi:hypothetical protein
MNDMKATLLWQNIKFCYSRIGGSILSAAVLRVNKETLKPGKGAVFMDV